MGFALFRLLSLGTGKELSGEDAPPRVVYGCSQWLKNKNHGKCPLRMLPSLRYCTAPLKLSTLACVSMYISDPPVSIIWTSPQESARELEVVVINAYLSILRDSLQDLSQIKFKRK